MSDLKQFRNGLQIGDTNITKISGPISMYYLCPKQEIYDNGGADNFPLFLLFGDYHESKKNSCDPCYNVNKNSICYKITDENFLKLLDTLSSDELPVDFYTEHWFNGAMESNTEGYLNEIIANKRLWCYNKYRTDAKYNKFENYCPSNKIRWHMADIRLATSNMNQNKIDDIATDLLKNINFSNKYQDMVYIESQIFTILNYFSYKENRNNKFIFNQIFNEDNMFKNIDDFKRLLKILCNNDNNKLNIKKFGEILFKNYID